MSEIFTRMLDGAKAKDPFWMIELGLLYCGESNSPSVAKKPELKQFSGQNPKEGFKLIDEGFKIAEARNPISALYDFALRICQFFMAEKNLVRKGEKKVVNSEFLKLLEGQCLYSQKTLAALKDMESAPSEMLESVEKFVNGSLAELALAEERINTQNEFAQYVAE